MRRHSKLLLAAAALFGAFLLVPNLANANSPQLNVIPERDLRFGSFAVPSSGYREVSPTGTVISSGVFSLNTADTGPARFTVVYDRGNNGRRNLNLRIQLVFSPPPTVQVGGVTAQLSAYRSDLPNAPQIAPGQIVEIFIPNCRTRTCSRTFHLGGRLDVTRTFGGGRVAIPIPVDATLISTR